MAEEMTVSRRRAGDENRNGKFGYFGCTPSFLQWLNSPWFFLALVVLAMIGNSAAVLGILATVLPQIEKRFNLSSFDSGMIAASNDVPAVILGLFVAHFGHYGNKIRWIGIGSIVTGIGLFIGTIPHYIIDKYQPPQPDNFLCHAPAPPVNGTGDVSCSSEGVIAERYHLAIILIGQFIAGIGSIPLFAFPPAIFRETLKAKHIPLCLGFWQVSVFVGPMIAFAYTEPLLETWVDINQPEGAEKITPQDPRWISAWWLGFLGPAALCFLMGLITLGMPEHIKSQLSDDELDEIEKMDDKERELSLAEKLKGIPRNLIALLTNWTFVFNSLAFNSTLMFAEGIAPFIAKILILRFGVEPQDVGKTLNIAIVPPLVLGVAVSIVLLRIVKIEDSGKKSALVCFLLHFGAIFPPMACLLAGCDNINLVGHAVDYGVRIPDSNGKLYLNRTYPALPDFELASTCNQHCKCGLGQIVPVCGSDKVTYLNPCFAGCIFPTFSPEMSLTGFTNCSCIPAPHPFGGSGEIGFCDRNCKNWLEFLVMVSLFSLCTFAQLSPSKVVVMRAVKAEHLSFAFALHYLSNKLLANIPGPIIFGHVVDLSCDIWQKVCDKTGFCMFYDLDHMMIQMAIITGSLGGIGLIAYFITWLVYKEAEPVTGKRELQIDNPGYQGDIQKSGFDTRM